MTTKTTTKTKEVQGNLLPVLHNYTHEFIVKLQLKSLRSSKVPESIKKKGIRQRKLYFIHGGF